MIANGSYKWCGIVGRTIDGKTLPCRLSFRLLTPFSMQNGKRDLIFPDKSVQRFAHANFAEREYFRLNAPSIAAVIRKWRRARSFQTPRAC
jgi:hypothetical protein